MADGNEPCPLVQQHVEIIENQLTTLRHRNHTDLGSSLPTHQLPGNDVGVMLQLGDQNLIVLSEAGTQVSRRYEVDGVCRPTDEDQFARLRRTEKGTRLFSHLFVCGCSALAEVVNATVDVGVLAGVEPRYGIDDRLWLLRRCGVVEVHQRPIIDSRAKDRKIPAHPLHVKALSCRGAELILCQERRHTHAASPPTAFSRRARTSRSI